MSERDALRLLALSSISRGAKDAAIAAEGEPSRGPLEDAAIQGRAPRGNADPRLSAHDSRQRALGRRGGSSIFGLRHCGDTETRLLDVYMVHVFTSAECIVFVPKII